MTKRSRSWSGCGPQASATITGIEESSVRALAKVEQALPDRLRRRVSALNDSVVSLQRTHGERSLPWTPKHSAGSPPRAGSHEHVRFDYRRPDGDHSRRLVEPHQLLSAGHLWYLIAWDLRRDDWRTFRLDRLGNVEPAGGRFTPRDIPGGDAASYLAASVASMPRSVEAVEDRRHR